MAHTLTDAVPDNYMTLANGWDYSNLFGTSKNGRSNICIAFDHVQSELYGELSFTLPEVSLVSGVFIQFFTESAVTIQVFNPSAG